MSSKILKTQMSELEGPLSRKLKELFPGKDVQYKLIYRASEDGFGVIDFHRKCDNNPNTLTVIMSEEANVFGGFISTEWDSTHSGYKTDHQAFIFSLVNKDETPLVLEVQCPEYAIYNDDTLGPTFGAGMDISIRNNSDLFDCSSTRLGYSFKHPKYEDFSEEAKRFLAGSYYFRTKDIEVFSLKPE